MRDELPAIVPDPDDAPEFDAEGKAVTADGGPWRISGVETAEWSLGKLATAEASLAQLNVQKRSWEQMLDRWWKQVSEPIQRTATFFRMQLEDYALREREQSPRDRRGQPTIKSVALPSGVIQTRASAERFGVQSEIAVINWARGVRVSLTPAEAELVGWVTDTEHDGYVMQPGIEHRHEVWEDDDVEGEPPHLVEPERYIGPMYDLVVEQREHVVLEALRALCAIYDVDVAPEGAHEPLVGRTVCGPDGSHVPGVVIHPADTTASVKLH